VLATRLAKKETLKGRSHCDQCNHNLKLIEVLPFIGFIINKGRCRYCNEKIDNKYIIYELIGGLLYVIPYLIYGFSLNYLIAVILVSVLIIESIADIDFMIVIDKIWMIGIIPLIVIRIFQGNIIEYLLSSAILFSIMFFIAIIGRSIVKKDALGGGDIKIYLFIGLVLSFPEGILSIFMASLFGLIYGIIFIKDKDRYLPLIPFITAAVYFSFLFGESLITWYLNLLGM
jgi:prepilin signal peptidase PulO-like enzyme (type II secretory pathway)